jgi:hypothetical protein
MNLTVITPGTAITEGINLQAPKKRGSKPKPVSTELPTEGELASSNEELDAVEDELEISADSEMPNFSSWMPVIVSAQQLLKHSHGFLDMIMSLFFHYFSCFSCFGLQIISRMSFFLLLMPLWLLGVSLRLHVESFIVGLGFGCSCLYILYHAQKFIGLAI